MLYNWLEESKHTVRNFNRIFNLSKLKGFDPEASVEIGTMLLGGFREVFVEDVCLIMELKSSPRINPEIDDAPLGKSERLVWEFIQNKLPMVGRDAVYEKLSLSRKVIDCAIVALKNKGYIDIEGIGLPSGKKRITRC